MAPAQHAYAAGDLLTITGQNYNKNVTFDLYLLHEQRALTTNLASLAFMLSDQQTLSSVDKRITECRYRGYLRPVDDDGYGQFQRPGQPTEDLEGR